MPDITTVEIVFTQEEVIGGSESYINDYVAALCNVVSMIRQEHDITGVTTFYDQNHNLRHPGNHKVLIEFNHTVEEPEETAQPDLLNGSTNTWLYNRGIYQIESTGELSEYELEDLMGSYMRLDTRYRSSGNWSARIRVHGEKWRYDMNGDAVKKEPDAEAIPTSGEGSRTTQ